MLRRIYAVFAVSLLVIGDAFAQDAVNLRLFLEQQQLTLYVASAERVSLAGLQFQVIDAGGMRSISLANHFSVLQITGVPVLPSDPNAVIPDSRNVEITARRDASILALQNTSDQSVDISELGFTSDYARIKVGDWSAFITASTLNSLRPGACLLVYSAMSGERPPLPQGVECSNALGEVRIDPQAMSGKSRTANLQLMSRVWPWQTV